ncbi:MAG: hypothetical protein BAJATHORv1_60155 [Candidatus Thorarchaeota archaeon]|nr:MAG: hypothetical protein BAJATHORv1_60155 [Candidatus Thorarchaeota archaeon]
MSESEKKDIGAPIVKVHQTAELEIENPLLVFGFPSAGLVGTIAANYLVEQYDMKQIAHVRSRFIPSAAIFIDGLLRHPFRIYADDEKKLLVAVCEVPIDEQGISDISERVLDWARNKGVTETVILDGIPVQGIPRERKVLFAAEEEKIKELEKIEDLEILQKGIITGIAGALLADTLSRDMVGFAFLTPTMAQLPDPEGAMEILQVIDKLYEFGIDMTKIKKHAEEVKEKLKEMAQQVQSMKQDRSGGESKDYTRYYA